MNKNIIRLIFYLALLNISITSKAQIGISFNCYITNDVFISPSVYQFDLYLLSTIRGHSFEYDAGQWGISIDSACVNGGMPIATIVSGSSQLNSSEIPTAVSFSSAYIFNIGANGMQSCGNGSLITSVNNSCPSPGTRVGTFRIINTVPFSCSCLNPSFNFIEAPGKTATKIWGCDYDTVIDITNAGTYYSYNTPGNCLKYCATGISENAFNNVLSVFPNPSSSEIRIVATAIRGNEPITISISNALGTVIRKETRNWNKDFSVDISSLAEGIYFVKVSNGDGDWVGRFVKQ